MLARLLGSRAREGHELGLALGHELGLAMDQLATELHAEVFVDQTLTSQFN